MPRPSLRGFLRWTGRGAVALVALFLLLVILGIFINPRLTPYLIAEGWRQGGVDRVWVPIEDMAPEMARTEAELRRFFDDLPGLAEGPAAAYCATRPEVRVLRAAILGTGAA